MAKLNLGLPSYEDSIFSSQEERNTKTGDMIQKISIDQIVDFENHPFSVELDNDMVHLIDSIQTNGLLMPVMVRPLKDGKGYEMISGHRRRFAYEQLGLDTIDAIVKDLDDDSATVLMVDSNLTRERIKPTEKGYAYKMRLEAMNHQGKRLLENTTSGQVGPKYVKNRSDDELADIVGISRKQIQRYIRLTYLIKPLQELVDETDKKKLNMAFNPAAEISFLKEDEQELLYEIICMNGITPSLSQAEDFKKKSKSGELSFDYMVSALSKVKSNARTVRFENSEIDQYFPKTYDADRRKKLIIKLLSDWKQKREKEQR